MEEMDLNKIITQLEELIAKTNFLVHQRIDIKNKDFDGINILVVTQRIFNGYKATKLLKNNNFFLEASTIVRSVIEAVFIFNDIMDNPEETFRKMEQLSNYNKQKLCSTILEYDELKPNAKEFDFSSLDKKLVRLDEFVNLSAKNKQLYEIAYRMLCNEVHLNQASLEKLLDVKDNVVKAIKPNHDAEDFNITYITLFYCIHSVVFDLNQRYNLELDSQLTEIDDLIRMVQLKFSRNQNHS